MHRIPLLLPSPSLYWDRNVPEHLLFENTFNDCNIEETDAFLSILDNEAEQFLQRNFSLAVEQLEYARIMMSNDNYVEGLRILNNIILRSPKHSEAIPEALKIRGNWYLQRCRFEGAVNDLTMYLYINKRDDAYKDLCEVYGSLTISFYLMRQYDITKKHLRSYNKYKVKLTQECFTNTRLEKIHSHICNFERELDDFENVVPKCRDGSWQDIPYQGFNNNKDIKQMSSACYVDHLLKKNSAAGVFVNADLPEASVVLLEKPISKNVNAPLVQCEICLHKSDQVYTCLDCRYKTYCSLQCLKQDQDMHQYECVAYKSLILFILDAKDLYSLFINLSRYLHNNVFSQKVFR